MPLKKMAKVNPRNFLVLLKTPVTVQTRRGSRFGQRRASRWIASPRLCAKPADRTWKDRKSGLSIVLVITRYFLKIPMETSWRSAVALAQSLRTEADQEKITRVSIHG